ncbi:MAG: hypothetical protein AAFR46_17200 [Pseudomonadota bacterium]
MTNLRALLALFAAALLAACAPAEPPGPTAEAQIARIETRPATAASELPFTRFDAVFRYTLGPGTAAERQILVYQYASPLGAQLKRRFATPAEIAEFQRICEVMWDFARDTMGEIFDEHAILLVEGTRPLSGFAAGPHTSFDFRREDGCDSRPRRGTAELVGG